MAINVHAKLSKLVKCALCNGTFAGKEGLMRHMNTLVTCLKIGFKRGKVIPIVKGLFDDEYMQS
jgi:hypothetical protein